MQAPRWSASSSARAVALVAATATLLLARAWRFRFFFADDALISLRYADRLLHGHGLTWTDGESAEGYSNLLWVLGTAAVGLAVDDLMVAARVLGSACAVATLAALVLARRDDATPWPAVVGATALAATGPLAAWIAGGLETPLVAALLAAGLALADRQATDPRPGRSLALGGVLALLALARADGLVLVAGVLGGLALGRGPRSGHLRAAIPPLIAATGQEVFRLAYHHDLWPAPARAKVVLGALRLRGGLAYLADGFRHEPLLWAVPVGAWVAVRAAGAGPRLRAPLATWATWALWITLIGGDILPADRHLVPLLVAAAFVAAEVAATVETWRPAAAVALVGLAPLTLVAERTSTPLADVVWDYVWIHGPVVSRVLHASFGAARPLVAVEGAGALPYFSGYPSLDMLGLNDQWLATHPPDDLGTRRIGHELGDVDYLLRRAPDVVFFCALPGQDAGCFGAGPALARDPRFQAGWTRVRYQASPHDPVGTMWIRRTGVVGVVVGDGEAIVPGYLLAGPRPATPAEDGVLEVGLAPGDTALVDAVPIPAGHYRVVVDGSGEVGVAAHASDGTALPFVDGVLELPQDAVVRLEVRATGAATVRRVVLRR